MVKMDRFYTSHYSFKFKLNARDFLWMLNGWCWLCNPMDAIKLKQMRRLPNCPCRYGLSSLCVWDLNSFRDITSPSAFLCSSRSCSLAQLFWTICSKGRFTAVPPIAFYNYWFNWAPTDDQWLGKVSVSILCLQFSISPCLCLHGWGFAIFQTQVLILQTTESPCTNSCSLCN